MATANCWEVKGCGFDRPGLGRPVCPAVTYETADGFLGGKNGGRACSFIPGTFCAGEGPHPTANKEERCQNCTFFRDLKTNYQATFSPHHFHRFVQNSATRHLSQQ